MTIDLPDGFDEAPADVQVELLRQMRGDDLASAIREELGLDPGIESPRLNIDEKAEILLTLRDD